MGKKLGTALIIYGILNFLVSLFLVPLGNGVITLGAFVWMIIMKVVGAWLRRRAKATEFRDSQMDKQTELLKRMADRLDEQGNKKGGG